MHIVKTIAEMKRVAREARGSGRGLLGLVPTMGALHEGHFSLVRAAPARCTTVAVSIFVNPKQFGPAEDLARYPRSLEADCTALASLGVDYVFAPTAGDMYPDGFRTSVVVEGLSSQLEGRTRPGHFAGVTTVVLKLLETIRPDLAFFGRKDAQQLRIIRQMAADLNLDAVLVGCPIVREADGLALSSRNAYLDADERRAATGLSRGLRAGARQITDGVRDASEILDAVRQVISTERAAVPDYVALVDAETFEPVSSIRATSLLLLAVRIGATRLIDNALIDVHGNEIDVVI